MLTPEQVAAIRDRANDLTKPITDYLLQDIARRISEAGQLTGSASYQIYRAQQLGMSRKEIEKELKRLLKVSEGELKTLLTQSAEVGYRFDLSQFGEEAVPFEENSVIQQIVEASVQLATDDFKNITQTLGMVDPYGNALPLQETYQKCMDFAFEQVATGATDYNTAVRNAVKNLTKYGIRSIDYESGVHRSLEAAARGCVMGGLGLMQEKISQQNHDDMGADGWEISAHAASAPDHEPIQGKQYTDKEYTALNNSLIRRIGTLNCGHAAYPIIMGVSDPQYTEEELEQFRLRNEEGVTFEGKHYTMYEATQTQRRLERAMRTQKRKILVDEAVKDDERLLYDQIRLRRINEEYVRFSRAADLPLQSERAQKFGFSRKNSARAVARGDAQIKMIESFKTDMAKYGYTVKGFDYYVGDSKTLKEISGAFERMAEIYPNVADGITIQLHKGDPSDFGWYDNKTIYLNSAKFKNWKAFEKEYMELVDSGYFPAGTTPNACCYHEFGHAVVESFGIRSYKKDIDRVLQKFGYGYMNANQRKSALSKELSLYSTKTTVPSFQEVVAESFSEWYNSGAPRRFCEEFLKEVGFIDI